VVSSIPTKISYTADTIYVNCQLRRKSHDDSDAAKHITSMYKDGSAPGFLQTLITEAFKMHPTPSILQNTIDVSLPVFIALKGKSPTYAVTFRTLLLPIEDAVAHPSTYARGGSAQFEALREYVHSFVFDRWHVQDDTLPAVMASSASIIASAFFTLPPLNYHFNKPVAIMSGIPPAVFGKQHLHVDLLALSIHRSLKPHLGTSKLQNFEYFRQAFGIEVHLNYSFTKDVREDVYIVHMSNINDITFLSRILYSSTIILTMGLPTTFFPIQTAPPSTSKLSRKHAYYGAVTKVINDISSKRKMLTELPSIVTPSIRDPHHLLAHNMLCLNKNVVTFTVFRSPKNNAMLTRLFTQSPVDKSQGESIIRSWFSRDERPKLFVPLPDTSLNTTLPPESILLNNVLGNCPNVLTAYANILGVAPPQLAPSNPPISSPALTSTSTSTTDYHDTSPDRSATANSTIRSPPPAVPNLASPPRPINVYKSIQHKPKKRSASSSPPSDQSSNASRQLLSQIDEWDDTQALSDNADEDASSADSDEDPATQSVRINHYESVLRRSIPKDQRTYIDESVLTDLALYIYDQDDKNASISTAQNSLRAQVNKTVRVMQSPAPKPKSKGRKKKKPYATNQEPV